MKLSIGVTGHRNLLASENAELARRVRAFLTDLSLQFPDIPLELISGLAEGADQLVAEVALDMDLDLVAVLPFNAAQYREDFTTRDAAERFDRMIENAEVICLPTVAGVDAKLIATDQRIRDLQHARHGAFIANHCHILLAIWDGRDNPRTVGTAGVVRYHLTAEMPLMTMQDRPSLLADNENDLAFHIVCSRSQPDGAPAEGLAPYQEYWLTGRFGRMDGHSMPEAYRLMLSRLEDYNRDLVQYNDLMLQPGLGLLDDAPDWPRSQSSEIANRLFIGADRLAVHFQRRFALGLYLNYLLACLMGLLFIVYSEVPELRFLSWMFLAVFGIGVAFHLIGERRQWHRKYLDYRALAEGLRVQVYWGLAGVIETRSTEFAYDNFLQKQDMELAWVRHVMRSASLRRDWLHHPDERWVDWVIGHWVGNAVDQEGQLAYYRNRALDKTRTYRLTERMGQVTLWVGIVIAIVLATLYNRFSEVQQNSLMILMGVLPLLAGIRDAYSHKKAEKELIKQYRFMARVFANARRMLDQARNPTAKRELLRAVGDAALQEHAEWILMHRERPLEHGRL